MSMEPTKGFFEGIPEDQTISSIDELTKVVRFYGGQGRSKKQKRSVLLSFGESEDNGNTFLENVKVRDDKRDRYLHT